MSSMPLAAMPIVASRADYRIVRLNQDHADRYQHLLYPGLRRYFGQLDANPRVTALGISVEGAGAGLALAEQVGADVPVEVLHLEVAPRYRGRGWATDLLGVLERELQRAGIRQMRLYYRTDYGEPHALARVLRKRFWEGPTLDRYHYTVDEKVLNAPWLSYHLPAGVELFDWDQLAEVERIKIETGAGRWYPWSVYPLGNWAFDPFTSLGLRRQGEIAGWLVSQRLTAETVKYKRIFVTPELQQRDLATALLAEGIRRQCVGPGPHYGTFSVQPANDPMKNLTDHLFLPYIVAQAEEHRMSKTLA